MKRWIFYLMIAAALAGMVVTAQWYLVIVCDDFSIVQLENEHYKVFAYGFPFEIVHCDEILCRATAQGHDWMSVVGNWVIFTLVALIVIGNIRQIRFRDSAHLLLK